MPFIQLNVTLKLTHSQKKEISEGLGEVMKLIPGKVAAGTILYIEDGKTFYAGGNEIEDYAFIETDICGKFPFQVKYDFTVALFQALKKVLGFDEANMSMKLQEHMSWGGFGDFIETDEMGQPTTK